MKIILDPTLKRIPPYKPPEYPRMLQDHAHNVANALGFNRWQSPQMTWLGSNLDPDMERTQLGFIGLVSEAYNHHEKLRVTPHDLWFVVMSQIAKIVNSNSDACRPLFSRSDEKIEIMVPTDDVTAIDPVRLMMYLANLVPTNGKLFVPELSTADLHVKMAMAAVFADAVQSYYDYSTFCCGIPEIEVTGTTEDWQLLDKNSMAIAELFKGVGLEKASQYMVKQAGLFATIGAQVMSGEVSVDFWKDIFRSKNIGSGGELEINGWITTLFYDPPRLKKIDNFQFTLASFDYSNKETGRKFKTAYGAFEQLRSPKGFIYSGYGNLVFELPK